MIEWFSWLSMAIAVLAGIVCLGFGAFKQLPNDYTLGAMVIVEVILLAQLVMSVAAPAFGNTPTGSPLEFYTYLISAIVLVPLAGFWALIERTRWSTLILGVAGLAVAIMLYRMWYIWSVQIA